MSHPITRTVHNQPRREADGSDLASAMLRPCQPRDASVRSGRQPLMGSEAGLATAEYAIATLAAVGFAALLVAVLSSGEIQGMLMSLVTSALTFG
ncbi:DUF4244 domain-containing protein [Arthrobacter sp. JZ12]|uniref:DUF4244 domain-containing protein n=1 Tax=Arthrobacter sp. JZ12 TaxID=2654190 RepID=UPI002B4A3636|nr:DUF4244 domain-containing protein [Arthrobacter sp. JZ12]WRH25765.1 DUF4244 domain-containing protein [Arthrobacter sp. JZ12]